MLWEDEESVALVIKNVEERDAGLYSVIATNELGVAECCAKLAIRGELNRCPEVGRRGEKLKTTRREKVGRNRKGGCKRMKKKEREGGSLQEGGREG